MRACSCGRALAYGAVAVGAAELAGRLLHPRSVAIAPVAVDLRRHFSEDELRRGRRYARPQLALGLAATAVELGSLSAVAAHPPGLLARRWGRPAAGGALTGAVLSAGLGLPALPLRALARRRSIAYGLDTQSWGGWASDRLKASAIGAGMAAVGGGAVVALMQRFERHWWAPAAGGGVALAAGLTGLAPVVLDPVFNRFTPLPEGLTRADVLELARDAGVKVRQVYSVDASRRTTAANAYVTGLGATKRVVLFDTLLQRYDRDEVRLVVAHELAHVRNRDVPRQVAFLALIAPAMALAVQRISDRLSSVDRRRRPDPGRLPGRLASLGLVATLLGVPSGMIAARLSRAVERRADQFALELAGAPEAFVSFERRIALQNVADIDPPRWVSRLLASHPPTGERIGAALAFAARDGAAG